jgi:hypothetical protein
MVFMYTIFKHALKDIFGCPCFVAVKYLQEGAAQ